MYIASVFLKVLNGLWYVSACIFEGCMFDSTNTMHLFIVIAYDIIQVKTQCNYCLSVVFWAVLGLVCNVNVPCHDYRSCVMPNREREDHFLQQFHT